MIEFLGNIYYFLGIFLFFISFCKTLAYFKFIDIKEWVIKFKKITGKNPEKEDFRNEGDRSFFIGFGCLSIIESVWLICGLLSNSWIIFSILIVSGILIRQFISLISFPLQKVIGTSYSLIKTILILILSINHFHFHIDLYQYLISLAF